MSPYIDDLRWFFQDAIGDLGLISSSGSALELLAAGISIDGTRDPESRITKRVLDAAARASKVGRRLHRCSSWSKFVLLRQYGNNSLIDGVNVGVLLLTDSLRNRWLEHVARMSAKARGRSRRSMRYYLIEKHVAGADITDIVGEGRIIWLKAQHEYTRHSR